MGMYIWTWILGFGVAVIVIFGILLRRLGAAAVAAGFLAVNAVIVLAAAGVLLTEIPAFSQQTQKAEGTAVSHETRERPGGGNSGAVAIGAALAAGLAAIGAGIAVAVTGSAAIGATTEKPEMLGRSLIFVGLAEGIAIYGLIIAFMILTGGFGG